MTPCFAYIRVSTQKQGEGVSLDAQRDAIIAFAQQRNLTVTKWFEERETAAKRGRSVFNEMIRQLKQGAAPGLITHKIDRSARNLRDWTLISELPKHGVTPYFVADGLDFTTRGGRLSANLQAVIAEDYIYNLREETIKGLNGRLKQGLYPFRAPIGYRDNGKGKAKTPDPKSAPQVREMFELYASGQHSLRSLQREMRRRGLQNTKGRPVSLCGIETIMSNPFYTGVIAIKRTGQTFDGVHEPIIPASLFRRVQMIKDGRCGPKVTRHNHLYQGLFRCGFCDGPMSPERQKGHVYYRCQKPQCATKTIREDTLTQAISGQFSKLVIKPAQAEQLKEQWKSDYAAGEVEQLAQSLELKIADEAARLDRLTDLLVDGTLSRDKFLERERVYKLRLAELQEQRKALPDTAAVRAGYLNFLELMKSLTSLHEIADPAEKRVLVKNCFSNRTVRGKEPCFEPYSWLEEGKYDPTVLFGTPERDRDRTGRDITQDDMSLIQPLFDLLKRYSCDE